jgi:hypothetical protein
MSEAKIPAGYHTVTPRMAVPDVDAEVEFLRGAFGATGEVPVGRPAEIRIGNSIVLVGPADQRGAFPAFLYLYVDDADVTYHRAVAAGAITIEEPANTPTVTDGPWSEMWAGTSSRSPIGCSHVDPDSAGRRRAARPSLRHRGAPLPAWFKQTLPRSASLQRTAACDRGR